MWQQELLLIFSFLASSFLLATPHRPRNKLSNLITLLHVRLHLSFICFRCLSLPVLKFKVGKKKNPAHKMKILIILTTWTTAVNPRRKKKKKKELRQLCYNCCGIAWLALISISALPKLKPNKNPLNNRSLNGLASC